MIHFDAHSDTTVKYFGDNRYTHGTHCCPVIVAIHLCKSIIYL